MRTDTAMYSEDDEIVIVFNKQATDRMAPWKQRNMPWAYGASYDVHYLEIW